MRAKTVTFASPLRAHPIWPGYFSKSPSSGVGPHPTTGTYVETPLFFYFTTRTVRLPRVFVPTILPKRSLRAQSFQSGCTPIIRTTLASASSPQRDMWSNRSFIFIRSSNSAQIALLFYLLSFFFSRLPMRRRRNNRTKAHATKTAQRAWPKMSTKSGNPFRRPAMPPSLEDSR